jgi:hypothetical protein
MKFRRLFVFVSVVLTLSAIFIAMGVELIIKFSGKLSGPESWGCIFLISIGIGVLMTSARIVSYRWRQH